MKRTIALLLALTLLLSGCGRAEDKAAPESIPGVDVQSGEWTGLGGCFTLESVDWPQSCLHSFSHAGERYYVLLPDFRESVFLRGEEELFRTEDSVFAVCPAEDGFWYSKEDRTDAGTEIVTLTRADYEGVRQESVEIRLPRDCYFRSFDLMKDGFCLNCSDRLLLCDRSGKPKCDIPHEMWKGQLCRGGDGTVYYVEPFEASGGAVSRIDETEGRLVSLFSYPDGTICSGDRESAFLLIRPDGLYRMGPAGETAPLTDGTTMAEVIWEECGLGVSGVTLVEPADDGSFLIHGNSFPPMRLVRAEPDQLKPRTRLTLGVMGSSGVLSRQAAAFNARSTDCYVQVIDLTEGGLDTEQALLRLNTRLLSGEGPDMLAFGNGQLSPFPFLRKGMLRDLAADLDADADIDRKDLWTDGPIVNDCGGLYLLAADFRIETRLGLKETFGDVDGWRFADYLTLAENTPDDRMVMYNLTRDYFLQESASRFARRAIDWQTGSCDFDNADFIQMLEAVRDMKETPEDANNMVFGPNLMADGFMATELVMLNRVTDLARVTRRIGKPVSVIGWPTPDGSCGTDMGIDAVGVLSTGAHPEDCWAFLKDWLLHPGAIPAYDPLLREQMEEAKQIEPEEDGGLFSDMLSSPITEAEIGQFCRLLGAIEHTTLQDETVMSIIRQETAVFLSGDRTAAETARLIQSRVSLYVSEQA